MVDESFMDNSGTCAIITSLIYAGWPVTCATGPGRAFPLIPPKPCSIKHHDRWGPQHTSWNETQASYTIQLKTLHYKALHFFSPERTTITFDCLVQGLQFLSHLLSIQHNEIDRLPPRFPERAQATQDATLRLAQITTNHRDDATDMEDTSPTESWHGGDVPARSSRESTCTLVNVKDSHVQEETRRLLNADRHTSNWSWEDLPQNSVSV